MSFIYYTQSKLVFGVGSQNQLEALLRENAATSILLVYSGDYVFDLGIHDVINQAARNIGANLIENGDVVPNPHIDLVRNSEDDLHHSSKYQGNHRGYVHLGGRRRKFVRYGQGGGCWS